MGYKRSPAMELKNDLPQDQGSKKREPDPNKGRQDKGNMTSWRSRQQGPLRQEPSFNEIAFYNQQPETDPNLSSTT